MTSISKGDVVKKIRDTSTHRNNKYSVAFKRSGVVTLENTKTKRKTKYAEKTFLGGGGSFRKVA